MPQINEIITALTKSFQQDYALWGCTIVLLVYAIKTTLNEIALKSSKQFANAIITGEKFISNVSFYIYEFDTLQGKVFKGYSPQKENPKQVGETVEVIYVPSKPNINCEYSQLEKRLKSSQSLAKTLYFFAAVGGFMIIQGFFE